MAVHVLIVDADTSAAIVTSAMFKRIAPDAVITWEPTPERGWLSIQQTKPDVLIIDPATQGPSGTLLIQLCNEDLPTTRVVVLASAPTPALRAAVRRLEIDVYLEKPATMAKLTEKLRAVLTNREDTARPVSLPTIRHP